MEELLSLKWNNHRSTFLHILTILRDKQLYTDVTLACEGRFYSVHRLVLSTCSDYFSAMFDRTTCKNPIIVLKDIKCEDLEALLDYMYLGEVNVRQADLASLIKAAECLRVKGLAVPDDEPPPKRGRGGDSNFRKPDGSGSPPSKRKRRDEGQDGREDIRPGGGGGASRPKTPQSQSRLSPGPQEGSDATASPSHSQQQQQQQQASSDLLQQQQQQQQQQQPNAAPQSSAADEHQSPFVKVEMEDSGGDDMGGGDAFNINNDSFKEETSEDHVGDLSNDLPEFLQQSTDGSYSHSFAGPSFQPDLPNWQGDQVLSSNNFSGLGFPSQSQDGSQNTGTSGADSAGGGGGGGGGGRSAAEKPSVWCEVCGKGFVGYYAKYNLKRHFLIHKGERPFGCSLCQYRSNQKVHVTSHVERMHRGVVVGGPPGPPHNGPGPPGTGSATARAADQKPPFAAQPQPRHNTCSRISVSDSGNAGPVTDKKQVSWR